MRVRHREVNIMNMSLLDILCGAMGAFAFLMLALFPYYRPISDPVKPSVDPKTFREALRQLADMRAKAVQFSNAYSRSETDRQRWYSQAEHWQAEAQRQSSDRGRLNREVQALRSDLASRNSLIFSVNWEGAPYDVDLWVIPEIKNDPTPVPAFDALKKPPLFNSETKKDHSLGESASDCRVSPCSEMRVFGQKAEGNYELYYSLYGATSAQTGFVYLTGYACCEDPAPDKPTAGGVSFPAAVMNGTVPSVHVGTLHIDDKHHFTIEYTQQFKQLAAQYSAAKAFDQKRADDEKKQREEQQAKTQEELEQLRQAKADADAEVKRLQEDAAAKKLQEDQDSSANKKHKKKKTETDGGQ